MKNLLFLVAMTLASTALTDAIVPVLPPATIPAGAGRPCSESDTSNCTGNSFCLIVNMKNQTTVLPLGTCIPNQNCSTGCVDIQQCNLTSDSSQCNNKLCIFNVYQSQLEATAQCLTMEPSNPSLAIVSGVVGILLLVLAFLLGFVTLSVVSVTLKLFSSITVALALPALKNIPVIGAIISSFPAILSNRSDANYLTCLLGLFSNAYPEGQVNTNDLLSIITLPISIFGLIPSGDPFCSRA